MEDKKDYKVSPEQVEEILERYWRKGENTALLAMEFGISERYVLNIVEGKAWVYSFCKFALPVLWEYFKKEWNEQGSVYYDG